MFCTHEAALGERRYCPDCGSPNRDYGRTFVQGVNDDGELYDIEQPLTMRQLA